MIIVLVGPEVVLVDLDTYKAYNQEKSNIDIALHACWYDYTELYGINPTVDIVWKGYHYVYAFNDLINSNKCCDNLILKLHIDLANGTLTPEEVYFVPVITEYGNPKNIDYNISFGVIKVDQNTFDNHFLNIRR